MISHHRGHEIIVKREQCLGGWDMLYFTVVRESDGYFCVDSFEDSDETVRDMVKHMKARVDNELVEDDPWGERADEERDHAARARATALRDLDEAARRIAHARA